MKTFIRLYDEATGDGAGGGGGDAGTAATTTSSTGSGTTTTQTTAQPAAWDGTLDPDHFAKIPGAEHLSKRFTSFEALAKSYVSAERMLSNGNKVAVPNENSTPEEWDAFYAKAGRPEKPEDYGIAAPEGVPKEVWSEDEAKEFAGLAHKLGLSKKAANALVTWQAERIGKAFTDQQAATAQAKEAAVNALKQEWGQSYDQNLAIAKQAAQHFGGEELINHPLANDPTFIKAMVKAGQAIGEGKSANLRNNAPGAGDPGEEINKVLGDKGHPYWNPKHPGHKDAVDKMQRLYAQKFPEPANA